ncbi:hypothetical protein ABPG75_013650 [Micractinium tetrahymenae]
MQRRRLLVPLLLLGLLVTLLAPQAAADEQGRALTQLRQSMAPLWPLWANTTTGGTFARLYQPGWRQRLETEVMPAMSPTLQLGRALLEWLDRDLPARRACCDQCRKELKCHLTTPSAFASFVAAEFPSVIDSGALGDAWENATLSSLMDAAFIMHVTLLQTVDLLHQGRLAAAGTMGRTLLGSLGWNYSASPFAWHSGGPEPCLDAAAVLLRHLARQGSCGDCPTDVAARLYDPADLAPAWQRHLDSFFRNSIEHARPHEIAGSPALVDDHGCRQCGRCAVMQWAVPVSTFEAGGYLSSEASPRRTVYEGGDLAAYGYAWYPRIQAVGENATLGMRMGLQSLPPPSAKLEFTVNVTLHHAKKSSQDWRTEIRCSWPDIASQPAGLQHICHSSAQLPLLRMLHGEVPGFAAQNELVFTFAVHMTSAVLTVSDDPWQARKLGMPLGVGTLGTCTRLLTGPAFRMGYELAKPGLWGVAGFPSGRLPQASAKAAWRQLEAAHPITLLDSAIIIITLFEAAILVGRLGEQGKQEWLVVGSAASSP